MRAFISYSLNDKDQYILTLLSQELRNRNFILKQSNDFHSEMTSLTKININKSQLFIGLITEEGGEMDRVMKEWRLANVSNVPSILMIENTVDVSSDFNFPYIRFDRLNPEKAVDELNKNIAQKRKKTDDSNAWAWVLGGAALIAIIGALSKDD